MENPNLSLSILRSIELQGEEVVRDKSDVVALDRRRNGNREAIRALSKQKSNKVWFALGPMLIKLPSEKAVSMLQKDQVVIDTEINKIRSELKVKVNKLRDLEYQNPIPGLDLKPMSKDEMSAINQVLGGHAT